MSAGNGHGPDLFDHRPSQSRALVKYGAATMECPHCNGTGRTPAETFGQRVRALRLDRGLSANELSMAIGGVLGGSNIRQIEAETNQNPRLEGVRALATFFGVRPGWLLDGDRE